MPEPDAARLEHVSVRFPRRASAVLQDVSLRVAPGEQVVVLGASGSGKSTVLQTLTGVVPHTVTAELSGHVTVAGVRTSASTVVELSRLVGVLAQDPSSSVCLPHVDTELALPLENRGTDPGAISGRIDEALTAVGASHLRGRITAELSGGEVQRVALAATLVAEPTVLLLDEPTSMLDPAGVDAVRQALGAAVQRYRPAVVLVEHRLDDLAGPLGPAGLPARAVVLSESGRVLADGPTERVLREQSAELVAAGCWLPLEAELHARTGVGDGLRSPANRRALEAMAAAECGADTSSRIPVPGRGEPVLRVRGLAVRDRGGGAPALLAGIDLDLHTGEVVALLGANGVGKSSLLLTLAGLLPPAVGAVTGPRPGMVFQNPEHQFVATTVCGEIAHGLDPALAERQVADGLRTHRLENLAAQSPFRLSGGEKRRLSLAAMLAHQRLCLLLDEPTLGLDRRDTVATVAALRRAAGAGRAVVLASHDLRTVVTLADRVVVLAGDGVLADGPTTDVLRDEAVLSRAGLVLPELVSWLLEEFEELSAVRRVLERLDEAVVPSSAPSPSQTPSPWPSPPSEVPA